MKATTAPTKYSGFFGAFRQARLAGLPHQDHHELVLEFTKGRTSSLHDLAVTELLELTGQLRALGNRDAAKCDRMRKKVIGILKGCGYILPDGKADMPRIYAWVLDRGYLHKELNSYTDNELPRLVFQAEQVQASMIQQLAR